MQPGFFDLDSRHLKLDEKDPLKSLTVMIDWEAFHQTFERIRDKPRKKTACYRSFKFSRRISFEPTGKI